MHWILTVDCARRAAVEDDAAATEDDASGDDTAIGEDVEGEAIEAVAELYKTITE